MKNWDINNRRVGCTEIKLFISMSAIRNKAIQGGTKYIDV